MKKETQQLIKTKQTLRKDVQENPVPEYQKRK